jgi:hypothetical protein
MSEVRESAQEATATLTILVDEANENGRSDLESAF